jgi:hypothetical protein
VDLYDTAPTRSSDAARRGPARGQHPEEPDVTGVLDRATEDHLMFGGEYRSGF